MRNVSIILAASGWGAANFATADGALNVLQKNILKPIIDHPDLNCIVYYAAWQLSALEKSFNHSVKTRKKNVLQATTWLRNLVEGEIKKGNFILVIGGDHSLAMGTWSGVKNAGEDFGLIWIDAHMDAHTYETSLSNNPHGMPVSALLGSGDAAFLNLANTPPTLKPFSLIHTGIRSYEVEEQQFLEKLQVEIAYHHKRYSYDAFEHFTKSRNKLLKQHSTYGVSFDIDGVDPSYCPGTGTPADGGIELEAVEQSLKGIVFDPNCIGLEIVEYNPHLDKDLATFGAFKKIIETLISI